MENIDIIILTSVVLIAFVVFIVTCLREFFKMEKVGYTYNPNEKKYGRDALYYLIERLFDDTNTVKSEKVKLLKVIDRTISDMESDGVYFPDELKDIIEQERESMICEYSGLPSTKSYGVT